MYLASGEIYKLQIYHCKVSTDNIANFALNIEWICDQFPVDAGIIENPVKFALLINGAQPRCRTSSLG